MLAVKYHHLRALIHRPFLCLPWLRRNDLPFMDLLKRDYVRIRRAEKICVLEAQETAHLLHSVSDERSLMHDFPWWQMISCLICASSILLVAGAFFEQEDHVNINEVDLIFQSSPQDLLQDADTCLKVFEALSINSTAAQKSKDMLKSLTGRLRQYTERKIHFLNDFPSILEARLFDMMCRFFFISKPTKSKHNLDAFDKCSTSVCLQRVTITSGRRAGITKIFSYPEFRNSSTSYIQSNGLFTQRRE